MNRGSVPFNCLTCGQAGMSVLSVPRKYCSRACARIGHRRPVIYQCLACGVDIHGNPSKVEKYCSKECLGTLVGEKSLAWKGGIKKIKFREYLNRAQKMEYGFSLTEEEFLSFWNLPCHYCGAAIQTIGLDRVDNALGYENGNIVPCCIVCNRMKRDFPLDVFLSHVDSIRRHLGKPSNWIDTTATVGKNTVIWHFARVLAKVVIGSDCSIGSAAEIGSGTVIGNETRISANVFLPSNSVVGDGVFLGPAVVATDDKYPRAGNDSYYAQPPIFEDGCSVGARSVILPGVRIGARAMVGAGSIVTKDVPPRGHVRSEPAQVKPYSGVHHVEHKELFVGTMVVKGDEHIA